jgi:AcrR family transcriptional regulator
MAERVKSRRYHSPRRQEQAAATRLAILEAAKDRFERDGYAPTTMAAIAKEAGVALKTVYLAFDTKSGLLRALWHLLLRGDEEDTPIGERPWYREVLAEPDPERAVRLGAHSARLVKERAGALLGVIRAAAATDPDAAELWRRIESDFYENQRRFVQTLHDKGALRSGLGVDRGADIMWTLNHPELWHLLVGARGWSPEQYERWFGDTVCAQLLGRDP